MLVKFCGILHVKSLLAFLFDVDDAEDFGIFGWMKMTMVVFCEIVVSMGVLWEWECLLLFFLII